MPLRPNCSTNCPIYADHTLMKNILSLAFAALTLLTPIAQAQTVAPPAPQTDLPRSTLHLGKATLQVQTASSERERAIGLMSRTSLDANEGMLFVFPERAVQCFWMRNTLLALTAAFIADDGRIVNLTDMQPLSDEPHCSAEPVRYVLEAQQGWFSTMGVKVGSKVHGAPFSHVTKAAQKPHQPKKAKQ